jgi:asparaginyl-tRNA synthetase
MIEPEMAFSDLADDADLAEEFVRYLCGFALRAMR